MAAKIRLLPTPEQEILFLKSAGTARWAYNYFVKENERIYQEYKDNGNTGPKSISEGKVRKHINNVLKPTTHMWLKEVGCNVVKQAIKDANHAFQNFFKGLADYPTFKSKHHTKPAFYVNYESLKAVDGGFRGEKLGIVRTAEPLPILQPDEHYSNPRISFDGKYWCLSVGYNAQEESPILTGEVIGIDMGVKELAVLSNGTVYHNINKTPEVKRLEKKLHREQRKLSRMLEDNTAYYIPKGKGRAPVYKRPLEECKNIQKQKKVIELLHRRLKNIRTNYLHQTTTEIVKTKPSRIVVENLNVRGMMKNQYLAKAIQDQKLSEFKWQILYKAQRYGIEIMQVPRFYPSSKTCSYCGNIKKDLTLKDRIYKCPICGAVIDRDLNAAINLANYQVA